MVSKELTEVIQRLALQEPPLPLPELYSQVMRIAGDLVKTSPDELTWVTNSPRYSVVCDMVEDARKSHAEAVQWAKEWLAEREDRPFYDMMKRETEKAYNLLKATKEDLKRSSMPSSAGDIARCSKCNGTGEVECHVCDGRGRYMGRRGDTSCDRCSGKGRIRCTCL